MTDPATPDELATLYLRGRDVPCPGCGYNRRDGTMAACPECATPIEFGLALVSGAQLNHSRSTRLAWVILVALAAELAVLLISIIYTGSTLLSGYAGNLTNWISISLHVTITVVLLIAIRSSIVLLIRLRRQSRTPAQNGRHFHRIVVLVAWASIPLSLSGIVFYAMYFIGLW